MKKIVSLLLLLAVIVPFTVQAQESNTIAYQFVNLTTDPSTESLDLYRNDNVVFFDNPSRQVSPERVLTEAGSQTFDLYARNVTPEQGEPLASLNLDLQAGDSFLLIATEIEGALTLLRYDFDRQPVAANRARLEVLHLNSTLPPLALVGQNLDILMAETLPGDVTRAEVPGGTYQMSFREAANLSAEDLLTQSISATPGTLTTLIVYGVAEARLFTLSTTVEQLAVVRWVHAARITPTIDVYFNEERLFEGLNYQEAGDYTTLAPGDYTVSVFASGDLPGSGTPLWTGTLSLSTTAPLTIVLFSENQLRVSVNQDDHQLIPFNEARIRFINVAFNLPLLTVSANDQPLVDGLEYALSSRNLIAAPETFTYIFRETGGADYATLADFRIVPNHSYTFVVAGNPLINNSVEVMVLDWTWKGAE